MIKLEEISYRCNDKNIFSGLGLSLSKGSYVSIAGSNGSGKTSLAMIIKGFLSPTSGKIFYDNEDVTGRGLNDRIAYIFSNPENQLVSSLVPEDISFGPENQGVTGHELETAISRAINDSGIAALSNSLTHQLSGGQQQRVSIAGILAMNLDCIIFDEALSMIDPPGKKEILSLFDKLSRKEGISVIHITHNLDDILRSDRVIALKDGSISFDGSPCDILENVKLMSELGWDRKGLAGFIKGLVKKRLLPRENGYSPENIAESVAGHYDPES